MVHKVQVSAAFHVACDAIDKKFCNQAGFVDVECVLQR